MDEYVTAEGQRLWRVSAKIADRERSKAGFTSRAAATKAAAGLIAEWRVEITTAKVERSKAPTWSEALESTLAQRGPRGAWRLRTVESYTGLGEH